MLQQIWCKDRIWELGCDSEESRTKWIEMVRVAIGPKALFHTRIEGWLEKQGGIRKNWKTRYASVRHRHPAHPLPSNLDHSPPSIFCSHCFC